MGQYRLALRQAETAYKSNPSTPILNTLGIAQYRVGDYQAAEMSLKTSAEAHKYEYAGDIAFLAMAYHYLGNESQAREYLARLRNIMKSVTKSDLEANSFLHEAEILIDGPSEKPKD